MTTWILGATLVPLIISLVGTGAVRQYALRTRMVDVPNHRSSHTIPTPRGGGIAVVAGISTVLGLLLAFLPEQRATAMGILGGGLFVATIGLLDDRFELSAKVRLCVQAMAALWLLSWLRGVGPAEWVGWDWTVVVLPAAALFVIWSTNLYNFMDGLDGFAGGQAVVAATAAALLCLRANDSLLAYTMLATSGAAVGFLAWNWPPAKIFMGDCGSGFLGFLFAAVAVAAHQRGTISIGSSILLMLIFFVDSTLTLLRRIARGERWYQAHRSHAYQLATQLGASHQQVTIVSIGLFSTAAGIAVMMELQAPAAGIVAVAYSIAVVGIWIAINWLFAGRTQTLASINRPGVLGGRFRQTALAERMTADRAKVFYLRFTQFQSQLRSWRSTMRQNDLLAEATGIAARLGYNVAHDWLDGCGAGTVEAAGEKWILLDFNMTKRDQIRQILRIIQDEAERLNMLTPDLRSMMQEVAAEPQYRRAA